MKGYALYRPLGWILDGLSRLPFGVLYLISDVLFAVVFHLVRYRRGVALKNIADSFPELPPEEHRAILRRFYRNFTDYFVETIKLNHISDDEMRRRMVFENISIVDSYLDSGRSVAVFFSHTGNWEWVTSVALWSRYGNVPGAQYNQVYRPLRNEWFDRYFLHLRSRFGTASYAKRSVLRDLLRLRRDGVLSVTGFMSDQKPSHGDPTEVVEFLSHPTAMITGTETLARKLDMAVAYFDMQKTSRGHYKVVVRPMTDDLSQSEPFAMTDLYASMLEETIRRNPAIWLWTHKRWKYPVTLPENYVKRSQASSCNNS